MAAREFASFARLRTDTHAAVLVEFALALPILLLIMVGMFDFGILLQRQQVVTNAAREGARMAILVGYSTADIQNRVTAYLVAGGVLGTPTIPTPVAETITPASGPPFQAMRVTVEVPYTFTFLAPFAAAYGGTFGQITMRASALMRVEVAAGGT